MEVRGNPSLALTVDTDDSRASSIRYLDSITYTISEPGHPLLPAILIFNDRIAFHTPASPWCFQQPLSVHDRSQNRELRHTSRRGADFSLRRASARLPRCPLIT